MTESVRERWAAKLRSAARTLGGGPTPVDPDFARVAIISTPRSGNTWLRTLLADVTGAAALDVHRPTDVPWESLPQAVILQVHWPPTTALRQELQRRGFRVLTMRRHPLDVLISIVHFCRHEPQTRQWLDGAGGDETTLLSALPSSAAVTTYACSPRFAQLLAVTPDWTPFAVARACYEQMAAEPLPSLRRVLRDLGIAVPDERLSGALDARSLDKMRPTAGNQHYWRGSPGLWRALLTAEQVETLRPCVGPPAAALGYELDADPTTTAASSDALWRSLAVPPHP